MRKLEEQIKLEEQNLGISENQDLKKLTSKMPETVHGDTNIMEMNIEELMSTMKSEKAKMKPEAENLKDSLFSEDGGANDNFASNEVQYPSQMKN